MTADEKRERRQARHELAKELKRVAIRRLGLGLYSTEPQIRAGVKTLLDAYIAGQMAEKAKA